MLVRWLVNFLITSMIFFPQRSFDGSPRDYRMIFEDAYITTADRVRIHGWFLKSPEEKGVILFFHGNAGNISHRLFKAKPYVAAGYSVLLMDYRGYGESDGSIKHQKDVILDAEASFDWLVREKMISKEKIILYGESLGSHPSIDLATKHQVRALVLESPYTSFLDLGKIHYPFVPSGLIKDFAFSNTDIIQRIRAPLFILHGTEDEICPYSMAEALLEMAPAPKELFTVQGGSHNTLPQTAGDDYWKKPLDFLKKL